MIRELTFLFLSFPYSLYSYSLCLEILDFLAKNLAQE